MSLFKSLSTGGSTVKLMKMNSIPGTEDLRFLLSQAKDAKKCAELPFQNPTNGMWFTIKVIPAVGQAGPKWTFERGESPSATFVWMRESAEVMMIQNKIKVDCYSTSSSQEVVQDAPQENLSTRSAQSASGSFNNMPAQNPNSTGFGFDALQNSGPQPSPAQYGGWMPDQFQVKLPEPYALQQEVADNILVALTDPKTGLLKFFAFVFFLQREVAHHEKNATKLSVLTFDFKDDKGELINLPVEFVAWLTAKVKTLVTPIDVLSRLETGEFVLLLSGTSSNDGAMSAEVLHQQIVEDEDFIAMGDPKALAIGCASIPETCTDAGVLIAASLKAKDLARSGNKKTKVFPVR